MVEGNYVSQGDILWPCQILGWQRWFDMQESQISFIAPLISLWWWITILRRVENNFLGLGSLEKSNRGVGNSVQPMFLLVESIFRKSAWKGKSEGSFSVASIFSALLGYSSCYKSLVQLRSCSAPPRALVFAWIVIQLRILIMDYLWRRKMVVVGTCLFAWKLWCPYMDMDMGIGDMSTTLHFWKSKVHIWIQLS